MSQILYNSRGVTHNQMLNELPPLMREHLESNKETWFRSSSNASSSVSRWPKLCLNTAFSLSSLFISWESLRNRSELSLINTNNWYCIVPSFRLRMASSRAVRAITKISRPSGFKSPPCFNSRPRKIKKQTRNLVFRGANKFNQLQKICSTLHYPIYYTRYKQKWANNSPLAEKNNLTKETAVSHRWRSKTRKFGIKLCWWGLNYHHNNKREQISPFWLVKSSAVFLENSAEKS